MGFNNDHRVMKVENSVLMTIPEQTFLFEQGQDTMMSEDWEVLSKFLAIYNIEPNWLDCNMTWGWYDEELGGWTGCMGKVCGTEY